VSLKKSTKRTTGEPIHELLRIRRASKRGGLILDQKALDAFEALKWMVCTEAARLVPGNATVRTVDTEPKAADVDP